MFLQQKGNANLNNQVKLSQHEVIDSSGTANCRNRLYRICHTVRIAMQEIVKISWFF